MTSEPFSIENVEGAIDRLPFPIASVLDLYVSDRDIRDRIDDLRHTLEASAQFTTTVLLSGVRADPELMAGMLNSVQGRPPGIASALRRASMGAWTSFGSQLGSAIRKSMADPAGRARLLAAFGIPDSAPIDALTSPEFADLMNRATELRNRVHGHGPQMTPKGRQDALEMLEAQLAELLPGLLDAFSNWRLVRIGGARARDGILHYEAHDLSGAPRRFRGITLEHRDILDDGELYLAPRHAGGRPLRIAPFIRVMTDPDHDSDACYLYDRIEKEEVHWKLFHTGADSTVSLADDRLVRLLRDLQVPDEGAVAVSHPTPEPAPADKRDRPPSRDGDRPTPSIKPLDSGSGLVGRPLADAVYGIAKAIDPTRTGLPIEEWARQVQAAGILIPGPDPIQKLRSAFNIVQHRYSRIGRGIWTWIDSAEPIAAEAATASELRAAAREAARLLDPDGHGLHYEDLKAELLRRGIKIAGPSQGRRVWSALGSKSASRDFAPLGKGRFRWLDGTTPRASAAPPPRGLLDLPGGFEPLVSQFEGLDSLLISLDPSIGREVTGDSIVYLVDAEPIARLELERSRLKLSVDIDLGRAPMVPGVVLSASLAPGLDPKLAETWLTIENWRSQSAAAKLLAARYALATGERFAKEGFRRRYAHAIERAGISDGELGWGRGGHPTARRADATWQPFWRGMLERHPSLESALRAAAPRNSVLGSPARKKRYYGISVDHFGTLVWLYVFSDAHPPLTAKRLLQDKELIERRFGAPLLFQSSRWLWLGHRSAEADLSDRAIWEFAWDKASDDFHRLVDAVLADDPDRQ